MYADISRSKKPPFSIKCYLSLACSLYYFPFTSAIFTYDTFQVCEPFHLLCCSVTYKSIYKMIFINRYVTSVVTDYNSLFPVTIMRFVLNQKRRLCASHSISVVLPRALSLLVRSVIELVTCRRSLLTGIFTQYKQSYWMLFFTWSRSMHHVDSGVTFSQRSH